ncbi:MAG: hypothetical protein ACTSWQ_06875 [Candidatus Thorarchaeota archaeon]
MTACPCGRRCADCHYEQLCGGCIGDACIHVRLEKAKVDRSRAKCLFCEMKAIRRTCPTLNPPPPKKFNCLEPAALEKIGDELRENRDELTQPQEEPDWPLLIPEVSDITETTSRLGVWPDEGDWSNKRWDPIAFDMTGYLFDKLQDAPWVREPDAHEEEDWHFILGPNENWIQNILFVDRLPDRLAMQTPPSAIMPAYLNRIYVNRWKLLTDEEAPRPWLLTHGYPSYSDWPPAWHWNLGIRMLSSLADYIGSQTFGLMGAPKGTWYPDRSRKTVNQIRVPYAELENEDRLLWEPGLLSYGSTEMDWIRFPGIIPFVPGADTNQLEWFTKQIVKMGYTTVAIDAVNTIAFENFSGLPEAVATVLSAGAKHIIVYGPWPLHAPSKHIPTRHVTYIPTALHMDMTDRPKRFWRKKQQTANQSVQWRKLPNYRSTGLPAIVPETDIEICDCPACQAAKIKEIDPRSIWRWGHMLNAGEKWQKRSKKRKGKADKTIPPVENLRLRYQGPSYAVFRKCLHYPPEFQWEEIEDIIPTLVFSESRLDIKFPDGVIAPAASVRWSWWPKDHKWAVGFPQLED